MKWRMIQVAPMDGTRILLWWRTCKHPTIGWWEYDEDWDNNKHRTVKEGWRSEGDACIPVNQDDCTHWMPLPAAPSSK